MIPDCEFVHSSCGCSSCSDEFFCARSLLQEEGRRKLLDQRPCACHESHDASEPLLSLALESQLFIHSQKAILNIKSAKIKEWFEIINSHIFFKTPIKKKSPDFFYMVQVGYPPKKGEKIN